MRSILIGLLIVILGMSSLSVFAADEPDQKSQIEVVDQMEGLSFDALDIVMITISVNENSSTADVGSNTKDRLSRLFYEADKVFWQKLERAVGFDLITELKSLSQSLKDGTKIYSSEVINRPRDRI